MVARFPLSLPLAAIFVLAGSASLLGQQYSICKTWKEVATREDLHYAALHRVSTPGTKSEPTYTGFWFFDGLQFDESGRYALAMQVHFKERDVKPADSGEIGYYDLQDNNKWTKIGKTTAWNWQQGCRLTWRGNSNEFLWNDRADDGSHFVCRAYDFKTGASRTLPRPFYDVSRDGKFALTHNFERMKHGGTNYVGINDRHESEIAPAAVGIEKMDLATGSVELIAGLDRIAKAAYPNGYQGKTPLYVFREGWNPSGTRFLAFLKNADKPVITSGLSISADGSDMRPFYMSPSHHTWLDDETILEGHHFSIYKDDGSGKPRVVAEVPSNVNFDTNVLPGGDWFLLDTYPLDGYQHLLLYHRPTKLFVPLAKLKNTAQVGTIHRVDLHARATRDGRMVCVDSSHENVGRQMYLIPIGHILDNPPK